MRMLCRWHKKAARQHETKEYNASFCEMEFGRSSIAIVESDGTVRGIAEGETKITAVAKDEVTRKPSVSLR